MHIVAGLLVLALSVILQTTIFSRILLLNGCADLVLLVVISWAIQERTKGGWIWAGMAGLLVALYSGMPVFVPIIVYPLATSLAMWFHKKIWRSPIIILLFITLVGTLAAHFFSLIGLLFLGGNFSLMVVIQRITLPSILLNFLFALPVYGLISGISNWLFPKMEEV